MSEPLQACYSTVPAGSRQIPDVVSKDVDVVYVMEISDPHKYARHFA